ncbi:MarR family winged helix-turn-helix transcriptional regulator [Marinactinospora thermotolerans]|uniref:DNA-binding transcriptional regulator, MarR family n=1 Tax=Marinactinospora thermotolerans DSM 45154 TaxID=1122192 RepID=A0A1T4RQM1_9ACTN|nr:MarR family transcriptional regulator [Marinactinospora thermotolerans]SKA18116.1 DNA-binding transcriptional regulator, MarR family [Marinactinospora thermotolerans DSM 45154]
MRVHGAGGDDREELLLRLRELRLRSARLAMRDRSFSLLTTTLTIQQLKALVLLAVDGEMAAHELARGIGVSVATLTGIVDRMVARGLVHRREDPDDRRVRRIGLTGKGQELIDELWNVGERGSEIAMARLDTETLNGLVKGLEALCEAIEAEQCDDHGTRDRG